VRPCYFYLSCVLRWNSVLVWPIHCRHFVEIVLQGNSDVEGGDQDSGWFLSHFTCLLLNYYILTSPFVYPLCWMIADGDTRARRAIQVYLRCRWWWELVHCMMLWHLCW
jgi:hypothetical protein